MVTGNVTVHDFTTLAMVLTILLVRGQAEVAAIRFSPTSPPVSQIHGRVGHYIDTGWIPPSPSLLPKRGRGDWGGKEFIQTVDDLKKALNPKRARRVNPLIKK